MKMIYIHFYSISVRTDQLLADLRNMQRMVNPANHVVVMDDVDCISSFCVDPQKVCPSVIPQIHSVQTIDLKLHIAYCV